MIDQRLPFRRHKMLGMWLALAGGLLIGATPSQAGLVTLNAQSPQTLAGENFAFNFAPAGASDGTAGTLTIRARGDYDSSTPTEFLTWDIDGLGIGGQAGPVLGGTTIAFQNGNDTEWQQSFSISGLNMLSITANGAVNITLDLNGDQNAGVGIFGPNPFVEVTLEYNSDSDVPEPSTLGLLTAGAVGLWLNRRRSA
ncbi:MAG: PEP-CTERM sorting domain-containing protein [Bryobacterales bacterium]|nr:PEP-CTERM sorting domain-containing protein [Bryobacterales bacterium]